MDADDRGERSQDEAGEPGRELVPAGEGVVAGEVLSLTTERAQERTDQFKAHAAAL